RGITGGEGGDEEDGEQAHGRRRGRPSEPAPPRRVAASPPGPMPYDLERQAAEAAARAAAAFIRSHAGGLNRRHVRAKTTHDLVTFVDEGAQRIVFDALREAFPDDDLLGEEGAEDVAARLGGERVWVVDP